MTDFMPACPDESGDYSGLVPPFTGATSAIPHDFELICADGQPAFRRTIEYSDGTKDEAFIGADGTTITPATWTPGSCADRDIEQIVLCDKDANGDIVGMAIAVWDYDETTGAPKGAPTFVDPITGVPYVPVGTLSPCEQCNALPPMTFYFQSSATGPVDFPGRTFSGDLPIARGKSITTINIDGTAYPVSITWSVTDADGSEFAAALQAAIQQRVVGSTVTVTPAAGLDSCAVAPQNFHIDVDCMKQTEAATSIDLIYDSGQDLVKNPAFLDTNGNPVIGANSYGYTKRVDNGGTLGCTDVANVGWQTNDPNGEFESWGAGFLGTTPTPRGTGIQEINANGENTLWQVITVATDGVFTVQAFVGGRRHAEDWNLRLSTGNTGATGPGDVLNLTKTSPAVGDTASPQPWTKIEQTGVALSAGTYTLSLVGPTGQGAIGGLFTDLRLFTTAAGTVYSLVADDTCVLTEDVTTTTVACESWQPQTDGNCEVVAWQRLDTGELLSNAAFWTQAPAPSPCNPASPSSGSSGSTASSNLIATYSVCANGVTLQRTIITNASGVALSEQWTDSNGNPAAAPTEYTIGPCTLNINRTTFLDETCWETTDGTTTTVRTYRTLHNADGAIVSIIELDGTVIEGTPDGGVLTIDTAWFQANVDPAITSATTTPCVASSSAEPSTLFDTSCFELTTPTGTVKQMFRTVLDSSARPIVVTDYDGTVLDGTPTGAPLTLDLAWFQANVDATATAVAAVDCECAGGGGSETTPQLQTTVGTVSDAGGTFTIPTAGLVTWSVRARTAGVTITVNGDVTAMDAGEMIESPSGATDGYLLNDTVTVATGAGVSARYAYVTAT